MLGGAQPNRCVLGSRRNSTIQSLTSRPYTITVTKDAVDDDGGGSFDSLKLIPASTCITPSVGGQSTIRCYD